MKKKNGLLIFLLLVCVGLLGAGIWLAKLPAAPADTTAPVTLPINPAGEEILLLEISHADGTKLVFRNIGGGEYVLEEYADIEQDSLRAKALVNGFSDLAALPVEMMAGERAGEYGFDTPTLTLTLETERVGRTEIQVGGRVIGGSGGVYVRLAGSGDIYAVGDAASARWFDEPLEYINRNLAATAYASDAQKITIERRDLDRPIVLEIAGDAEKRLYAGLATHSMTSPEIRELDSLLGGGLINSSLGLTAKSVASVNPTGEELRLLELAGTPVAKITIETAAGTTTYLAGSEQNGSVFLIKEGTPVLYLVSVDTIPWYTADYSDIVTRKLIDIDLPELASFAVAIDGEEYVFELSGSGDKFAVKCDDKRVDAELFREYFKNVTDMSGEVFEPDVPETFDLPPVFSARFTFAPTDEEIAAAGEGKPSERYRRLRLYPGSDKGYYVYAAGSCEFSVGEKTKETLLSNTRKFLETAGVSKVAEPPED